MRRASQSGSAIIAVLAALGLLLSLGVPFLLAGRLRSEASREAFDRARARTAVESAADWSLHREAATHPAVDPTPLWDAREEWDPAVAGPVPTALGEEWEDAPESWGVEAESLQARVSLQSAPPLVLQNLLHPCLVTGEVDYLSTEVPVTSTDGFPEKGTIFLGTAIVGYEGKSPSAFLNVEPDPAPPEERSQTRFQRGAAVVDARVFNLVMARMQRGGQAPPEFLSDLFERNPLEVPPLAEAERDWLERTTALRTGAYGAPLWGPAVWLRRNIDPEQPHIVFVTDPYAFSGGSVLRFEPQDGEPWDALVHSSVPVQGYLRMYWDQPTQFEPLSTRVRVLLREPVDLNSARPEVLQALATGVKLTPRVFPANPYGEVDASVGRQWVSPTEAQAFARAVIAERPLEGPADLWARVLQPMEERGELAWLDAWALHLNGLDPNHGALLQSTMPFGYCSGDAYLQRVDAAVRSGLGRTLGRAAVEQLVRAAPGGSLLRVWSTQEEFDDQARWGRGRQGTTTLPFNLPPLDAQHGEMPQGLSLRVGSWDPTGVVEPSRRDEDSYVIPQPARETDEFGPNGFGRTEHYDFTDSPLGWDVSNRGPDQTTIGEWQMSGGGAGSATSSDDPIHFQGWFDLTQGTGNQTLFEIAADRTDRDLVTAYFEDGFLVVRGYDHVGLDPNDPGDYAEVCEVRVDPTEYPMDTRWLHLSVLLRNMSPRGMQVAVDGVPRGEVRGLTHLTAPLPAYVGGPPTAEQIFVESTETFPNQGAIRIGEEVIEYSSKTQNSFLTQRVPASDGYIGGRCAREATDQSAGALRINEGSYPVGCAVELYGYNAILASDIPAGGARLSGALGPFSVARGLEGADTISVMALDGNSFEVGDGINGAYIGPLQLGEGYTGDNLWQEAFQTDGGYALLYQPVLGWEDLDGYAIGGMEIVRYSAADHDQGILTIAQRNVPPQNLQAAGTSANFYSGAPRTFVTEFRDLTAISGLEDILSERWYLRIMPISVKGTLVSDVNFLPASPEFSEFVQITYDDRAELTEWVRYDQILNNCFVRNDWTALTSAVLPEMFDLGLGVPLTPPGMGGPGGGPGGNPRPGGRPPTPGGLFIPEGLVQDDDPWAFRPRIGEPPQAPSRAAGSALEFIDRTLQFRGVMNTYDQDHSDSFASARLVPVFQTHRHVLGDGSWSGYVGRLDRVAAVQDAGQGDPSWFTVQWAAATGVSTNVYRVRPDVTYVAFREDPLLPVNHDPNWDPTSGAEFDPRDLSRLVKFPSGERATLLSTVTLGGDAVGARPTFGGFVDEVSLHTAGYQGSPSDFRSRGCFRLNADIQPTESGQLELSTTGILVEDHMFFDTAGSSSVQLLPASGILDVGGERIGYSRIEPGNGIVTISPAGRGLHGTEPRGHARGERVYLVDGRAAAALTSDVPPGGALLPVESTAGYAAWPLLLVDQELLQTTSRGLTGGELVMPRWRVPEETTETRGDGILRGRYGTTPADHAAGTIVYSFPCRWEDRYVPRSNSPGAAWYEVSLDEPGAYWRGVFFEAEVPDPSHKVRVLARAGLADWEDVEGTAGLAVVEQGRAPGGGPSPLGFYSDRLDLRVTFDWDVGAFDPVDFLATGWTITPRVTRLGVDYLAESRVERQREALP